MRLRYITFKTKQPYQREMSKDIFKELQPSMCVGYDHTDWPRVKLIYYNEM